METGNLLYRSETLEGGGLAEPVRLNIAGVKKRKLRQYRLKEKHMYPLADCKADQ